MNFGVFGTKKTVCKREVSVSILTDENENLRG